MSVMVRAVIPQYRHARRSGRSTCIIKVLHTSRRVEPRGFEPRTSAVQGRRSPRLSYGPSSPTSALPASGVGAPGLEPGTSALSGPRSNHLSYAPGQGAPNRPPAGLEINRFQHTHSPPRHAQQQPVPKTKQTRAAHVPTTPHHLSLCSQAPLPDPSSASHARQAPRLGPPRHTAHRSDA